MGRQSDEWDVIFRKLFTDWVATLPDGFQNWPGLSGMRTMGNYVDNVSARALLNSDQLKVLSRNGIDVEGGPANARGRGLYVFKMHAHRIRDLREADKRREFKGIDDSFLFEEGYDPNANVVFIALMEKPTGEMTWHGRLEVLRGLLA